MQVGRPSVLALGVQLRQGKSQLAAVLNGQSGNSPDWELIKDLVGGTAGVGKTMLTVHLAQGWPAGSPTGSCT